MGREMTTYDRALNMLSFRPRSVVELRNGLRRKGEPSDQIEVAINRLLELKLLDDATFARQFARMRILGPGASKIRIAQELRRKGVARELVDRAVEELKEEEGIDASAALHRVAEKKWRSLSKLDEFTRRRRLYAFLARRGFNPDEIRLAMNALGEAIPG
jgi:regulatory protein